MLLLVGETGATSHYAEPTAYPSRPPSSPEEHLGVLLTYRQGERVRRGSSGGQAIKAMARNKRGKMSIVWIWGVEAP